MPFTSTINPPLFIFMTLVVLLLWLIAWFLDIAIVVILPFALVIATTSALSGYYASDKIVLSLAKVRPPKLELLAEQELQRLVENLAITAGLPCPKLYLLDQPALNAFACGRDPQHASIVLTTGLMAALERTELEGVIAHEMAHIKSYDIRFQTLVVVFVGLVAILADVLLRLAVYGGRGNRDQGGKGRGLMLLLAFAVALLTPLLALIIRLAISRKREFLADASGVMLTRYPAGLASALEKIGRKQIPLPVATSGTAHLYLEDPLTDENKKTAWWQRLFLTHPPLAERIAVLRKI